LFANIIENDSLLGLEYGYHMQTAFHISGILLDQLIYPQITQGTGCIALKR